MLIISYLIIRLDTQTPKRTSVRLVNMKIAFSNPLKIVDITSRFRNANNAAF